MAKNIIMSISGILFVSQLLILFAINFYEQQSIEIMLPVALQTTTSKLDSHFTQFVEGSDGGVFSLSSFIDKAQYAAFKQRLVVELEDIVSGAEIDLDSYEQEYMAFDFYKMITDNSYATQYAKYYVIGKILLIRSHLNVIFISNMILLILIAVSMRMAKRKITVNVAMVGLASVVATTSLYLFTHNWIYRIFVESASMYSYLTLLVVVTGTLLDITFNKGNIVVRILAAA